MSLLIEALKQAEARKGPKGAAPADTKADAKPAEGKEEANAGADAAGESPTLPAADSSPESQAAGGLQLSLAPREDQGNLAAQAQTTEASPAAPAAQAAASEVAPASPSPSVPADGPARPAASASAPAAAAAPAQSAAPPSAQPAAAAASPKPPPSERGPSGRLQTGSEAARRTAREVMAAANTRSAPPARRWRVLLGLLVVVALLSSAALWWLTRQTDGGLGAQLANVPTVSEEVLAEATRGSDPPAAEADSAAPEPIVPADQAVSSSEAQPAVSEPVPRAEISAAASPVSAVPPTAPATTAPPAGPAPVSAPRPALGPAPTLRIERARQAQQPLLSAYAALNRGELAAARRDYQRALQLHPGHPDALLGLAVIAEREGDLDSAARRYREVLQSDPRNPTALAALLGSAASGGETRSESQLREALAAQPRSAPLHFALGNRLAAAERWAEAQQAYFDAAVLAPDDPDITFNLGVALDRLHKPQLALEHYLRAEELRRARPANYDPNALARRITTLSQQLGESGDRPR